MTVVLMDAEIFSRHRKAIVEIAETLYDKSPVAALKYGEPEKVEGQACYLAELAGGVVGYVFAYQENNTLSIHTLGTKLSERGKGIASVLIWFVAKEAQNRNIGTILVKGVDATNKDMHNFLMDCGFNEAGSSGPYTGRVDFKGATMLVTGKTSERMDSYVQILKRPELLERAAAFLRVLKSSL